MQIDELGLECTIACNEIFRMPFGWYVAVDQSLWK